MLVAAELGTPTPTAEIYMEPVIPPETKSLFEIAVSGSLEAFDLLVLSRPYAHLYYYLKEVHRMGRAPKLPPLHMHDLMQSQREAVRAYNWSQTRTLVDRLERLIGAPISDRNMTELGMSEESSITVLESTTGASRLANIVMYECETPSTCTSG